MRRLFCLSIKKISVLFGGRPLLILLTLLLLGVCFYTVRHAVTAERNDSVNMTVVDASRSELSSALVAAVREAPGFSVKLAEDIDSARIDMAEGVPRRSFPSARITAPLSQTKRLRALSKY